MRVKLRRCEFMQLLAREAQSGKIIEGHSLEDSIDEFGGAIMKRRHVVIEVGDEADGMETML
jgi:hypothetical protein